MRDTQSKTPGLLSADIESLKKLIAMKTSMLRINLGILRGECRVWAESDSIRDLATMQKTNAVVEQADISLSAANRELEVLLAN